MTPTEPPPRVTVQGASRLTGLAVSTLNKMRVRGDGPPFVKLGRKRVAYDVNRLEAWLASRERLSTSEAA